MTQVYETSPIKRYRRTRSEIDTLRETLYAVLEADNPMTVRQVFYRLVSLGAIPKTEAAYKGTVCRLLSEMRRDRVLPFGWLADSTRWMRKAPSFSSLHDALRRTVENYRRALWDSQPVYVEVWLEKDALAGVLFEETDPWDVPLMVTRGYPSLSYLYEAAEAIATKRKPCFLYYLGDHDPSGVDIPRKVEEDLREFAPEADIRFHRVAVNPEQIRALRLPTRPTKSTDSRSKGFEGESVEVDAIPPNVLRGMVESCIKQHIDPHRYDMLLTIEQEEREALERIAVMMGGVR